MDFYSHIHSANVSRRIRSLTNQEDAMLGCLTDNQSDAVFHLIKTLKSFPRMELLFQQLINEQ